MGIAALIKNKKVVAAVVLLALVEMSIACTLCVFDHCACECPCEVCGPCTP
jgi:hypothetical protein